MSGENGNAASGVLSLERLMRETETEVTLPEPLAARLGRATIRLKAIDSSRFRALFPIIPVAVIEGDRRQMAERERAWLEGADPEVRIAYQLQVEAVKYRAIAISALEPQFTYAQAERLGDDATAIYQKLLEFSGLIPNPAVVEKTDDAARAPEPEAAPAEAAPAPQAA